MTSTAPMEVFSSGCLPMYQSRKGFRKIDDVRFSDETWVLEINDDGVNDNDTSFRQKWAR